MTRGTCETAWVTPGHDCLCSYRYGHGAAVRPQTNDAIWDGVIGLWSRVAPLLSPLCARGNVPTGGEPEPLVQDHTFVGTEINEPLFGPHHAPELIVSL